MAALVESEEIAAAAIAKQAAELAAEEASEAAEARAVAAAENAGSEAMSTRAVGTAEEEAEERAILSRSGDATESVGKSETKSAVGDAARKLAKGCAENKALCASGALGAFVAAQFVSNSKQQQNCIAKCLPTNYTDTQGSNPKISLPREADQLSPATTGDPKKQPVCSAEDFTSPGCEEFCEKTCEALHPTNVGDILKRDIGHVWSVLWDDVLGAPWLKGLFVTIAAIVLVYVVYRIGAAIAVVTGVKSPKASSHV